jgi:hypothetical protein
MHEADREASPPELGNKFVPWSGCKLNLSSERLEKNASDEPSTKDGIETFRLHAALLRPRLLIDTVSSGFLQP